jgi:UDP-N-acetyl-2-amino-2-deoxyglucuronate dehydrogenase
VTFGATRLNIAILGCGRISHAHRAAILALPDVASLVAVCDPDREAAARLVDGLPVPRLDTLDQLLSLEQVDAVLICSPNAFHFEQARAVLAAGKHALVEKPLCETGDEARELARMAQRAGLVLAAGHTFRHGPAITGLMERMQSFGKLLALEVSQCVHWNGPQAPWWSERTLGEGLILSLFAPHALDFVQMIMGDDDPLRIHAEVARHQSGWQGEDEAMMTLAYPGKRMASVHISYNQPYVHDRKTLFFDKGVAEIEAGAWLRWNGDVLVEPAPGEITQASRMGGRDLSVFFRNQIIQFANAIAGQKHNCPVGDDAARLVDLVARVMASARANTAELYGTAREGQ